ncbi:MAG: hypothetical protein AMXMBFR59_18720 [Rhodanobacteraceae bacterium]
MNGAPGEFAVGGHPVQLLVALEGVEPRILHFVVDDNGSATHSYQEGSHAIEVRLESLMTDDGLRVKSTVHRNGSVALEDSALLTRGRTAELSSAGSRNGVRNRVYATIGLPAPMELVSAGGDAAVE